MSASSAVSLRVNGRDYAGWKAVSITAGVERVARDFSLSVTTTWPGAQEAARRILPGDACELLIGTDLVLTGYVDATPVRYSGRETTLAVNGRSKTADLVDCGAINAPGQWRNLKLERIAQDLAAEYGIAVLTEVDTGAAIADHQIQVGETAFESIDRMLRLRYLLATDDAQGRLVFIEAGRDRATTALEFGRNILSADAALDFKDRYSEYRCKGQRAGDDEEFGADVAEESASLTDDGITRKRVLVMKQSGQADEGNCRDRVEAERAHRKAKSLAATYVVAGWRQESGALWARNQVVRVKDPVIGFNAELLIAEVEYRLDDGGMLATLKVGPVDGYVAKASRAKKKSAGGGDGFADVLPLK